MFRRLLRHMFHDRTGPLLNQDGAGELSPSDQPLDSLPGSPLVPRPREGS